MSCPLIFKLTPGGNNGKTLSSSPSRIGNQPCLPTFAQPKDTGGSQIVQQRDLLGVPDALAKFDELLHKLEEA